MKGILEMKISKEKRQFLKKELKEYEKITPMTAAERKVLHEWVAAGYSVHENSSMAAGLWISWTYTVRKKISDAH